MSKFKVKLCRYILEEHFGLIVAKVGITLGNNGSLNISSIVTETNLKYNQVKKCLSILIHHNLCSFELGGKPLVEYKIDCDQILSLLRYPRYIYGAKLLYDSAAELIVEELLQRGRLTIQELSTKVIERLNTELESQGAEKVPVSFVHEKLSQLEKSKFVELCPPLSRKQSPDICDSLFVAPASACGVSKLKRKNTEPDTSPPHKKQKANSNYLSILNDGSTKATYCRVNIDKFNDHLCKLTLVQAITRRVDAKAGVIVKTILTLNDSCSPSGTTATSPLSVTEIHQALPKDQKISRVMLDQYLKILIDDSSEILCKVDESGGGMYSINFLKGLKSLCLAHLESFIREKYGSKSLRIFRILLLKRHVEQKQIEETAMINIKETKERLYKLYSDGIITATELCKTPDHAPARSTFLFTFDINHVSRMIVEKCYKALCNSFERRNHELTENKRLLDRQQRVDAIIATLAETGSDAQKEELEQLISPTERAQIAQVTENIKKLDQSELLIHETLCVFQPFLACMSTSKTFRQA